MIRRIFIALVASLAAHAAVAQPMIGQPAPDFHGTDVLTGSDVALHSLRGKPVVLEWNNFQCPFVRKFYSTGTMQQLQLRAAKQDVTWITINSSAEGKEGYLKNAEEARNALSERNAQPSHYLIDHDGSIGRLYGAKTTPHMFVIDANGTLVYMGAIDNKPTADTADIASATNYVTKALQDLKAGRPLATRVTQPYGCFVHYK